jgi:hypothetical protein
MLATALLTLATLGQTAPAAGPHAAAPARRRVVVSTPRPTRDDPARRPRVDWGLTEFVATSAQAGEPAEPPGLLALDAAPLQAAPVPAPSMPADPASCMCPCAAVPRTVTPSGQSSAQGVSMGYELAPPAVGRVIRRWVGPAVVVAVDGVPVGPGYSMGGYSMESSQSYSMPSSQSYSMPSSPQAYSDSQMSMMPRVAGDGVASMPSAPSLPSINIDARSTTTLEHGPRFGIGAGLFRSGATNRTVGPRNRTGFFGRRVGFGGTSYDGGQVCGPGGCAPAGFTSQ